MYLIESYYAEKISQALGKKGFESRFEIFGSTIHKDAKLISIKKDITTIAEKDNPFIGDKREVKKTPQKGPEKPVQYAQVSLFDYMKVI